MPGRMRTKHYLIAISLLMLLLALVGCSSGDGTSGPTDVPTETQEPTPMAETVAGVEVRPLVRGPDVELPEGLALLVEVGCTQCDGPTEGIERVYRDAAGVVHRDLLFSIISDRTEPYISSLAVSPDGQRIGLTICEFGDCGDLGLLTDDARTTLRLSMDGGETWELNGEFAGAHYLSAMLDRNVVIWELLQNDDGGQTTFRELPSGRRAEPPVAQSWPFRLSGEDIGWRTNDGRLLDDDGRAIVALGDEYEAAWIRRALHRGPEGEYAAMFSLAGDDGSGRRLGIFGPRGDVLHVFEVEGITALGPWLSGGELILTTWFPESDLASTPPPPNIGGAVLPAVIDLEAGIMRPISAPFLEKLGRHRVLAVVPAP